MIPKSTTVHLSANIHPTAQIGENCMIATFVEIGPNVVVGDNTRIQNGAFLPEGITLEGDVYIGPKVTFLNDKFPPSHGEHWKKTLVKKGAAIGGAATILPGVTIGAGSVVSPASVVSDDVEDGAIVMNCISHLMKDQAGNFETINTTIKARRRGTKK